MLDFYVNGQSMKMFSPVIAADSLNYLTAKFNFSGDEWEGFTKTAHFRRQDTSPAIVYDILLRDDMIDTDAHLNLTEGMWDVYLTGAKDAARLTSVVNILTVKPSGLVDAPLHELPQSVAEQLSSYASAALQMASAVKADADSGKFDGRDGKGFTIVGYYETPEALEAAVTQPAEGEMYGVGTAAPYDIYAYDFVGLRWVNNGSIQGPAGEAGPAGVTFAPAVDPNGILSWTNDGGRENPAPVSIKGPKGDRGDAGNAGVSAYEAAVAGGYAGTEATFNTAMSVFPYHNARHAADGADPITVTAGMIAGGAVTRAKLADDALYSPLKAVSSAAYSASADDIGKTIYFTCDADAAVTISNEAAASLPAGAEIAFIHGYSRPLSVTVGSSWYLARPGELGAKGRTLTCSDGYQLTAVKRIGNNWFTATGNFE